MSVSVEQMLKVIEKANVISEVNSLDLDKPLGEQGVDSLDFSSVLFNVEEGFGVSLPDEDIEQLQTINAILMYVNQRVSP